MSEMTFSSNDTVARCKELYKSGRQVWSICGDETARYIRGIQQSAVEIGQDLNKHVRVICHDRWCGFRSGMPEVPPCKDKTNALANGLQIALMSHEEIARHFPQFIDEKKKADDPELPPLKLDFDPAEDIIFIFTSVEQELREQPLTQTLLRNVSISNMCSKSYIKNHEVGTRGNRMIVLITSSPSMPETLSELKPEVMPLPDAATLRDVVMDVLVGEYAKHDKTNGEKGIKPLDQPSIDKLVVALCGLTTQDAEEAMALAVVKHKGIKDLDTFIQTLEDAKAKTISNKPGLRYIPKSDILGHCPPGYEALKEFIRQRKRISLDKAKERGITPIRGIALGGIPGVAKTEVAKYIARELGAIAILSQFGEMKGSLVGESERNMRVALQIGRAMHAVMIWDDVDKGSIGSAAGSYGGDGGTTGNMMGAILTDMSDPTSDTVNIFTFNRAQNVPGELLRPGRIDKRYRVVAPNAPTRLMILKDHIARFKMGIDDETLLEELAMKHTQDWTGAELAHVLVKEEAINVLADEGDTVNVARMIGLTKDFTPMSRQKVFSEDIKAMDEACSQFTKIGNIPDSESVTATPFRTNASTRARRQTVGAE